MISGDLIQSLHCPCFTTLLKNDCIIRQFFDLGILMSYILKLSVFYFTEPCSCSALFEIGFEIFDFEIFDLI